MQDWLKGVLELVGGISVVVCTTLAFCKGIFQKYIYIQVEKSAEKELERAKKYIFKKFYCI